MDVDVKDLVMSKAKGEEKTVKLTKYIHKRKTDEAVSELVMVLDLLVSSIFDCLGHAPTATNPVVLAPVPLVNAGKRRSDGGALDDDSSSKSPTASASDALSNSDLQSASSLYIGSPVLSLRGKKLSSSRSLIPQLGGGKEATAPRSTLSFLE
jgi:hypothetical protein